jgi:hypothetical protein
MATKLFALLTSLLLLVACGASNAGNRGAGGTGGGECQEGEWVLCADDGDCDEGMICVESGVTCADEPCPSWVCARPCARDADCVCADQACEETARATREGPRSRVCWQTQP